MENGFVILGIIALLFLSMYGYAYLAVAVEKIKQKREANKAAEKAELRRLESLKKQAIIDEKVRKFNERKEEIQRELMLLEKMKTKQRVS
jgi:ABC-type transport system involved in Fe-S cluster assembly fused permease/ATPase subunit